ncbi:MAG: bifunctional 4-hydroxy-2-oxoglutarate aldolase/2-dehydro-3-deoxy-phosphogluconate aldolase [Planctomycetes bacterium]|nr:bifunctional 4-hydroxy-2-oxoglutarate aldolase/2-dehydro-3-deoxy-phosphogluconate aldolase [Planctomycetota bacterium]
MDTAPTLEVVKKYKAVAVLRAPSAEGAIKACEAMIAGGLRIMEVTTTTIDWEEALAGVAKLEGVILGVGTVVKPEQVAAAKRAGAVFAVSPGFDQEVADACLAENLPFFPGIATPTEIMEASKHEAVAALKFFPAGALGGAPYLKSLRGPFPKVPFLPTGGISANNAREYLDAGAIAVGFSSTCNAKMIEEGDWEQITELSKEMVAAVE